MILHIILTHLGRLKVTTQLVDISFSHKNDITHNFSTSRLVIKMILHIILAHLGRLKIITRLDDLNHIHENVIKRQHILMKDHNKIICHTRI